jgi:hypothetical protein
MTSVKNEEKWGDEELFDLETQGWKPVLHGQGDVPGCAKNYARSADGIQKTRARHLDAKMVYAYTETTRSLWLLALGMEKYRSNAIRPKTSNQSVLMKKLKPALQTLPISRICTWFTVSSNILTSISRHFVFR